MSKSEWENVFETWAQGPATTEQQKCENAEAAIKKAIEDHPKLSSMDISVFAQGSYKARTNVKQDSDVDICVRLNSTFFVEYPEGKTEKDFDHRDGAIIFADYKNLVHEALVNRFGRPEVNRGNKAFDVHTNTYRVDADVVPTFEFRKYTGEFNSDGSHHYYSGLKFIMDSGGGIINWPDQTYENGIQKNEATNKRYKKVIRILKRLRNKMQDEDISGSNNVASFLIECLVWNVANNLFGNETYYEDVRNTLVWSYNSTSKEEIYKEWGEVNELKYLFSSGQPWTIQQANDFVVACWNYVGFNETS